MKKCKDCRFFDGEICKVKNVKGSPAVSACNFFSEYNKDSGDGAGKKCKDCRFFDGVVCKIKKVKASPMISACNHFSEYRS